MSKHNISPLDDDADFTDSNFDESGAEQWVKPKGRKGQKKKGKKK